MTSIAAIVEGHGEVAALPVLLKRLIALDDTAPAIAVPTPIRVPRDRLLNRDEEFNRYLSLAREKSGDGGCILIVLDADDDCPARLGPNVLARANQIIRDREISVVIAMREFEAWFIGAAGSLSGHRGFVLAGETPPDPENIRNAKGWIGDRMAAGTYGPTTDQPAFAALMSLQEARSSSSSFDKLARECARIVGLAKGGTD